MDKYMRVGNRDLLVKLFLLEFLFLTIYTVRGNTRESEEYAAGNGHGWHLSHCREWLHGLVGGHVGTHRHFPAQPEAGAV